MTTQIVTSADVKAHLNLGADTTYDAELVGFIDAASEVVERLAGHVISATRSYTFHVPCGAADRTRLLLPETPVTAVVSVVEYPGGATRTLTSQPLGATVDAFGYSLDDAENGVITRRNAAGIPACFAEHVVVTWSTGRAAVPPAVRLATLLLVEHLWDRSQVGNNRPAFNDDSNSDTFTTVGSFAVPRAVEELLAPYRRLPAIG